MYLSRLKVQRRLVRHIEHPPRRACSTRRRRRPPVSPFAPRSSATDAEDVTDLGGVEVPWKVQGLDFDALEDGVLVGTRVLRPEQVIDRMVDSVHDDGRQYFKSFYSSVFGGITTEPSLMHLPIDDHMVHRGHGVFDTAMVVEGCVYQLDQHVTRLMKSAERARIKTSYSAAKVRRVLLDTAAAGRTPDGFLRYWLSAGRGGFSLSGHDCRRAELYAIFYNGPSPKINPIEGVRLTTSPVPNKQGMFAEIKSVNYLQNALNVMAAQDSGAAHGIFVNDDGTICEGPNVNIGIITQAGVVTVPPFVECLAGCTMTRLIELLTQHVEEGHPEMEGITGIEQRPVTLTDVSNASEAFITGGSLPVVAATHWDRKPIGDGEVGTMVLVIRQMILNDMAPPDDPEASEQHTQVPYGLLTGMPEDL